MFKFNMLGQEIVEELSNLIQEQVILTDRRGFIQASTDPERINQFHEGALLSLQQKQTLYMTEQETACLRGVRKGIVLPLIIDEEPIAVLGITGEPDKIQPQAQLILRVVELFIQDSLKRKAKEEKVREREFFVFDWLTSHKKDDRFLERGTLLGIDVTNYQQVLVIEGQQEEALFTLEDLDTYNAIQNMHQAVEMIRWGQNKLLLLLPDLPEEKLKNELDYFLLYIKRRKKLEMAAGVGGIHHPFELGKSYNEAERALIVSKKTGRVVVEQELRFELVIQSIPETTKEEFIRRTVASLVGETELVDNLRVWFNENQSMQTTSQRLHIHKNTLNYRLQKVERLTGLSVSAIPDVFLLYLGIQLLDEKESHLITI